MPTTRLKNILNFPNLAPGGVLAVPHLLNWRSIPVVPDVIYPGTGGDNFAIAADDTNVTVTNNGLQDASLVALVESWHTDERAFGVEGVKVLAPQPFIAGGASIEGEDQAPVLDVVFRPGDPGGSHDNVYVTWQEAYDALQATAGRGWRRLSFDNEFASPTIPAGSWEMMDVIWTNKRPFSGVVTVTVADGATIDNLRLIYGFGLFIRWDGVGASPFTDPTLTVMGGNVRFFTTNAGASPMFQADSPSSFIFFGGDAVSSGLGALGGGGNPSPAPLVNVAAGGFFQLILGGGAHVKDNVFTGGAGSGVIIALTDDSSNRQLNEAPEENNNKYDFPALIAGGGVLEIQQQMRSQRWWLDIDGPTPGPYTPAFSELVQCDTSGGAVAISAPSALALGESFTVKDQAGNASVNNITITPPVGETIDGAATYVISTDFGRVTLVADGGIPGPGFNWIVL